MSKGKRRILRRDADGVVLNLGSQVKVRFQGASGPVDREGVLVGWAGEAVQLRTAGKTITTGQVATLRGNVWTGVANRQSGKPRYWIRKIQE